MLLNNFSYQSLFIPTSNLYKWPATSLGAKTYNFNLLSLYHCTASAMRYRNYQRKIEIASKYFLLLRK